MDRWSQLYQEKLRTPEELAELFQSGDICLSNGQITDPIAILDALARRAKAEDLRDIRHYLLLPMRQQLYMEPGMEAHIRHVSHFVSGFDREVIWEGRADYLPSHYSQVPAVWRDALEGPDVFYCTVSPMDKHGYFSCGTAADLSEIRKKAKRLYLEVNPTMPRTFGSHIHITEVDALVENDTPITEVPSAPISKDDQVIGSMIAEHIPDGATLQLGIGGIPNAVAAALESKNDLGVHTEMLTSGMMRLAKLGVINGKRKQMNHGKIVTTFAMGIPELYEFMDYNPAVAVMDGAWVNDPYTIAQNDNQVSINTSLEVDLTGQCASESIGSRQYSGTGGQADTAIGAQMSRGGKSIIALYSTAMVKDPATGEKREVSKIVPQLTTGAAVTLSRNDVDRVVTEYGVAELRGTSLRDRVARLIEIAHPRFREELWEQAVQVGILGKRR